MINESYKISSNEVLTNKISLIKTLNKYSYDIAALVSIEDFFILVNYSILKTNAIEKTSTKVLIHTKISENAKKIIFTRLILDSNKK
jgi:hypothetical protein